MNLLLKFIIAGCVLASCSGKQSIKYLNDLEQTNIKGHVTKLVTETYAADSSGQIGKLELVTVEIFDKLGNTITDTAKYLLENNVVVEFLTFNKNGSLSSSSTFENGKKLSSMVLKYDDGNCIAAEIYDSNGKLERYWANIKQTKFGLLSGLDSYDANGKFTMSYTNEYDSIYLLRATAKDSIGRHTSEVKIHLTNKKYNETVLEVSYFRDSTVQKHFTYKYTGWDTAGNWIHQTVFDDKGRALKMAKRFFTYSD